MSISIPNVSHREGQAIIPQGPNVVGSVDVPRVGGTKVLPLFRDYGKQTNDLITKNFPSNYKFEVNTPNDQGLRFVFAAEKKTLKDTNADVVFVTSQAKYDHPKGIINLVGTVDSEKLEGEVSLPNLGVTGNKAVLKGKFLDNNKMEASAEVQYQTSTIAGALGVFVKDDKPRVELQGNFSVTSDVAVGGLVSYYFPTGDSEAAIDNFQFGANYVATRTNFATVFKGARNAKSRDIDYSVGSRVLYTQDTKTTFGADVLYTIGKPFNDLEVKLAADHKFDKDTTGRIAFERSGKVRLAVAQKLTPNFTLTLGGEVNALRLEEHKVGLTASFTAQ